MSSLPPPLRRRRRRQGRLAGGRARQPGRPLRTHPPQRGLRGGRAGRPALGAAQGEAEVRRPLHGRPHGAGRPARGRAAAADAHERLRPRRRPRARRARRGPRPRGGDPRRDRPALRAGGGAARRRPGGAQRAQVAQARAGRPGLHRIRVGVGRPDTTDPEIVSAWVLGRFREPPRRGARAGGAGHADALERLLQDSEADA